MTDTALKPLALLYVRVSTNRQAKTGHSLDSQPKLIAASAELDGYRVEIITETGSGRNSSRPALNAALARLKRGEAQALYALDIDRLARSTQHLLEIANHASREGWRLKVVANGNIDTATPAGKLFLTMAAAFAQYESEMTGLRVARQHEERRERGVIWGVDEGNRSAIPAETLGLIIELRGSGNSLDAIAKHLTATGIKTAQGATWHANTIKRLLDSPAAKQLITRATA